MTVADALHGLDEMAWNRLYHAYGPAGDVPTHLRALRSADWAVRAEASSHLFGSLCHQGTRWQASGPTVPFLIALIHDPVTPDRASILDLLTAVAIGPRRDDELPFDPGTAFAASAATTEAGMAHLIHRLYHEQDPLDDEAGMALSQAALARWEADAYRATADRVATITGWVNDPDVEVSARAAALLAWFPPTQDAVSALLAVPANQPYPRASANLALAHLPVADRRINETLQDLLTPPHGLAAVTAAIALAYRTGDQIPDPALTILLDATARDLPNSATGWDRALRGFIALAQQRIGLT